MILLLGKMTLPIFAVYARVFALAGDDDAAATLEGFFVDRPVSHGLFWKVSTVTGPPDSMVEPPPVLLAAFSSLMVSESSWKCSVIAALTPLLEGSLDGVGRNRILCGGSKRHFP